MALFIMIGRLWGKNAYELFSYFHRFSISSHL
jgi:hypothetical protein